MDEQVKVATLAGGCFWCLEAVFEQVYGVESVTSGYAGGHMSNPTYEQVCMGITGHAEVTQVVFHPDIVSYRELLEIFFSIHDPTTLNRQGPDIGTQYRSEIFFHDDGQKETAEELIAELTKEQIWDRSIVTEVAPLTVFYPAEDYHREYYRRNYGQPYCQAIISPKVAKFRKQHMDKLKPVAQQRA